MGDESMQKLLYPYLPEPMRNKETFEWMLTNPEYRKQLETMMASQQNPAMEQMMSEFDYDNPAMKEQLAQAGMTPDGIMKMIMSDPDLAKSFNNPEVQAAIMDVSQNQMNIAKYANNPEVMTVFNKMQALFDKPAM